MSDSITLTGASIASLRDGLFEIYRSACDDACVAIEQANRLGTGAFRAAHAQLAQVAELLDRCGTAEPPDRTLTLTGAEMPLAMFALSVQAEMDDSLAEDAGKYDRADVAARDSERADAGWTALAGLETVTGLDAEDAALAFEASSVSA